MLMFYENGFIYTKDEIDKITKIHRSLKPIQQVSFYGLIEHYLLKIIENFKSQFDPDNPRSDFIYYFLIIDFDEVIKRVQDCNCLTESYKEFYIHPNFELSDISKKLSVKDHNLSKHLLIQQPLYYTSLYKEYMSTTITIEQDRYQSILKTILKTVLLSSFTHITFKTKIADTKKIDGINFHSYSPYLMGEIQESQWHRHRNRNKK
jgi:hypothetical protein